MEVLFLTIFVSLMLVVTAGLFFAWNISQRSHEQSDRLVLLPLADEPTTAHDQPPATPGSPTHPTDPGGDVSATHADAPTPLGKNRDDNN